MSHGSPSQSEPPSRRRGLLPKRFSLGALLALTTVCCLLLSLWINAVRPFQDQQAGLAVVDRLNGTVRSEPCTGSPWWRWMVESTVGEGAFVSVVEVDLHDAEFAPSEARKLGGLRRLRHLVLDRSSIADADFKALATMPELETLGLRYCRVSDVGIALMSSKPELEQLHLTGCDVSDESIDVLAGCLSLELLMVRWTRLSPEGVQRLRGRLPGCTIAYQPRPRAAGDAD